MFVSTTSPGTMVAMNIEMLLDFACISLDTDKVASIKLTAHWTLPDINEKHWISLEDSVLIHRQVKEFDGKADVSITMDRSVLNKLLTKQTTLENELQAKRIVPEGNVKALATALGCLVAFTPNFDIVTP
jgi:alkyl sulfatase BDS1-like metallo-beta-lactamase superfamily hydrolase